MKTTKQINPTRIIVSIEHGSVWPVIKACDHDNVEVIVINTDRSAIWKSEVEYGCDKEIEAMSELADNLKGVVDIAGENIKK